jgi:excinuclease ABC subunit C
MLARVADFNYFLCHSEKDALGLEANLIRRHKPHYNILLKDNKSFQYIRVAGDKIEITRHLGGRGKYFGPYFNGIWAGGILDAIYDIFGFRGMADAGTMEKVKAFLRGEKDFGAREILTQKMDQAAQLQQFEIAIRYRTGLAFLDLLKERTITNVGRDVNCDVFAYCSRADIFAVSVLTVRAGKLIGVQNFANQNDSPKTDDEKLEEFIGQYYLENIRTDEVITGALRGYKKRLVKMAQENAREYVETSIEKINFKTQFTAGACEELGRILGMAAVPKKIECFDISHMGGEGVVASMVVFIDGAPEKKLYRKFRVRHGQGNDDFLSMREVVGRRLKRLGGVDPSFGVTPDLIVVDGGKGQLSAASQAFAALDNVPPIQLAALAKREEEIFVPDGEEPIVLAKRSYALRLLQRLRDEAHRFAHGYQNELRRRESMR